MIFRRSREEQSDGGEQEISDIRKLETKRRPSEISLSKKSSQLGTERWTEWDKLYYCIIVLQYRVRGINKRDHDLILSGKARTSGECKLLGVFL